jgi:hypothetical protein
MTREEALALYHPIRASVRRILKEAFRVCNQSDFKRAAKLLGLWVNEKIVLPKDNEASARCGKSSGQAWPPLVMDRDTANPRCSTLF